MKDIHDIITHAKFGDDRLRVSGVVAGQISAFPIDFAGRTTERACDKSRTDRHGVFKLGSKVGHVTRHELQLFKVKRSKV